MTTVIHRPPARRRPRSLKALIEQARQRQRRRRLRLAALLIVAAGTAGIGYLALLPLLLALTFVQAASAALPNPCTLMTNAEVAKALGSKVATRSISGNGRYRTCNWTGQNLSGPGFYPSQRTLMVQVTQGTRAQFDEAARQTHGAIPVHKIGAAAYASGSNVKYLDVWQNGYTLFIIAGLVTNPIQAEKTAAMAAVRRL